MSNDTQALGRLLAARGVASRRKSEELIFDGTVTVDGTVADHPAMQVDPDTQDIRIDGSELPEAPPTLHYLFYKPRGCITTRDDPQGRRSIFDVLPDMPHRVEAVGRLDFDTEGALLLTNDGTLAHQLLHPSTEVPKRYVVKVWKTPSNKALDLIRRGRVYLDDGKVPPSKVRILENTDSGNAWLEITVTEGRNRLIRRLFDQLGHPVSKLRRETFATVSVRGMQRGQVRPLTADEVRRLQDLAAGRKPTRAGKVKYKKNWAKPKPRKTRPNQKRKGRGRHKGRR